MYVPAWPLSGNGYMTHIRETNSEELLIARQRFRNHEYIDGNN
jgi:hypothetical protein